jgi:hypothetical protein
MHTWFAAGTWQVGRAAASSEGSNQYVSPVVVRLSDRLSFDGKDMLRRTND